MGEWSSGELNFVEAPHIGSTGACVPFLREKLPSIASVANTDNGRFSTLLIPRSPIDLDVFTGKKFAQTRFEFSSFFDTRGGHDMRNFRADSSRCGAMQKAATSEPLRKHQTRPSCIGEQVPWECGRRVGIVRSGIKGRGNPMRLKGDVLIIQWMLHRARCTATRHLIGIATLDHQVFRGMM